MNSTLKIGFVGLGKLGMDCAEVFASHFTTYGYDIEPRESDSVNIVDSITELVNNSNWIFIAVPTPHEKEYDGSEPSGHLEPRDFNYSIVEKVLKEINTVANKDKNIVLISTVLPGTVRKRFDPLLDNHTLLYNPYLIAMGTTKYDMVNPEMLIIGSKDGNDPRVAELTNIYSEMMERETRVEMGTWEEAEGIKIFYNTYISAKIGIVNMIQDFAMKIGHMNSEVVAGALARSTMRLQSPQYMVPGMGDSGACHPRDNIALRWLAQEYEIGYDMFDTIMGAREVQAENLAKFIIEHAEREQLPIVIHGKSYKPGVPYIDGSYSLLIGHYIENMGYNVFYADPLTGDTVDACQAVVLMAHNAGITYGYTGKEQREEPAYFEMLPGCVIIDPWRRINKVNDMYTIIHYGDTR